ncbi:MULTISPECIES: spermidine/putrescine ABC transporter substrate-binding protein [Streptomyces]|uniref:Spermidine/putrescine ABC transporter substrate-binding protein n=1 Tax=Streptomyces californicus TaxID=67351 RepID=A0ABD7CS37_9ACTN|nr:MULTISPECIES: spermidine/putrescine ABC transporter substrate-binding protein [Streptomyces]MDP9952485.1 spermidine/putrescine transport system substrate-binding protein [Streptomyces sp. DSM 41269]QRV30474.1 spermidine/putrescine ABC transporter substrate-binding protein [Streptomyces californicus]QRV33917.1 spermidine/putrescine ABC transporter substrate-binding protein [Streptomyces californicus]QRV43889.1 spermidine/putrescine ABC transporter substrate-binding protein [Streptomyces calif
MSRRSLLRALGAGAAGAALAGCGVPAAFVEPGERAGRDSSATDHTLHFANWPLYIDTDDDDESKRPTLDAFSRRTGISVTYTEEINDNDEFFGKISPALMNRQQTGRDLIVISDWMAARFVRLGWVQEMDRAKQPNVAKYLDPQLRTPAFDEGRLHSVPWQSGITGIAYNRKKLGREIRSTGELWADDLRGRVTLLSGLDESFALLMQGDGVDITRWTADDFHTMCEQVEKRVRSKHIRRFTGNDYIKDLATGDVLACQAYSGDVIQLQADNPDIEFVVPEEGAELWAESLMIPNLARHKRNAERLIDHYYDPEVAAELAAWVNYVCPVPAARDVLASSKDEETAALAEDPLIFPDDAMRERLAIARDITSEERMDFAKKWNGIVGL